MGDLSLAATTVAVLEAMRAAIMVVAITVLVAVREEVAIKETFALSILAAASVVDSGATTSQAKLHHMRSTTTRIAKEVERGGRRRSETKKERETQTQQKRFSTSKMAITPVLQEAASATLASKISALTSTASRDTIKTMRMIGHRHLVGVTRDTTRKAMFGELRLALLVGVKRLQRQDGGLHHRSSHHSAPAALEIALETKKASKEEG